MTVFKLHLYYYYMLYYQYMKNVYMHRETFVDEESQHFSE